MKRHLPKILGLAGLALLVLSVFLANESFHLVTDGKQVEGTVMRVQLGSDGSGDRYSGIMYYAVIRFQTESGQDIEVRCHMSNKPLYRQGEQVMVVYDPDAPEKAKIGSFGVLWATPLFTAATGISLLGFSVGFAIRRRRYRIPGTV